MCSPSSLDLRLCSLLTRKQFHLKKISESQEALYAHAYAPYSPVFIRICICRNVLDLQAQSNTGSISGAVTDPSGAVVPGATVTIENPVSGYARTAETDGSGRYQFSNLPFNPYHLSVTAKGFGSVAQDTDVRSTIPLNVNLALKVAGASTTVTVEGSEDLLENDSTFHTDVDRGLFQKLPLESQSSSLSSLVTLSSPGVAADSNGLFHGLGDHASNSFSVDGQPITDQQSKVFSNQLPSNSIQSIEVISGAPPAEYGGKTSLVIVATTRSGQGLTKPTGDFAASYGTFGSATGSFDWAMVAKTGVTLSNLTGSTPGDSWTRRSSSSSIPKETNRISLIGWTINLRRLIPFT